MTLLAVDVDVAATTQSYQVIHGRRRITLPSIVPVDVVDEQVFDGSTSSAATAVAFEYGAMQSVEASLQSSCLGDFWSRLVSRSLFRRSFCRMGHVVAALLGQVQLARAGSAVAFASDRRLTTRTELRDGLGSRVPARARSSAESLRVGLRLKGLVALVAYSWGHSTNLQKALR